MYWIGGCGWQSSSSEGHYPAIYLTGAFRHLHRPTELIEKEEQQDMGEKIELPAPRNTSNTSVETALSQRRSIRAELADQNVYLQAVSLDLGTVVIGASNELARCVTLLIWAIL